VNKGLKKETPNCFGVKLEMLSLAL